MSKAISSNDPYMYTELLRIGSMGRRYPLFRSSSQQVLREFKGTKAREVGGAYKVYVGNIFPQSLLATSKY